MRYFQKDGVIRAFEDNVVIANYGIDDTWLELEGNEVLKLETPKPTPFHTEWDGTAWVDIRTAEEIAAYNRTIMKPITKRQFNLYLDDINQYDNVMQILSLNRKARIEFESVYEIHRNNSTVSLITTELGWTEDQVDQLWLEASKIQ